MMEHLKKGKDLLKQKRVLEAESEFLEAMKNPAIKEEALENLIKTANHQKNFALSQKRLSELVQAYPDNLTAKIDKAHLDAFHGKLDTYQNTIKQIIDSLTGMPLPSIKAGKSLLKSIQYAYMGQQLSQSLLQLLKLVDLAIDGKIKPIKGYMILSAEIELALENYQTFLHRINKLSQRKPPLPMAMNALERIAEKCRNPKFPDYNAPKVFGIGLSRTGTSSLNRALNILGYHSIHWMNPNTQSLIINKDFFLYDGFTDIPVSHQFESLYRSFPNAKFIFTTRPVESWLKSINIHYSNRRTISHPSELNQADIANRFGGYAGEIEWDLYAQHPSWEVAYDSFHHRVNSFFSDKPKDKLLNFSMIEGDGWGKLCQFLDKPVPETPFPHTNHGPIHMQDASS